MSNGTAGAQGPEPVASTPAPFVDAIALPRGVWLRPNLIGLAFP